MTATCTDADFERLAGTTARSGAWSSIRRIPDAGDWTCDLVLDIDFIVEWLCDVGGPGRIQFRVAPATLRFHTVSDLRIAIAWGSTGVPLHEASIDRIEREPGPSASGPRPTHRWRIAFNWPRAGEIAFDAVGVHADAARRARRHGPAIAARRARA